MEIVADALWHGIGYGAAWVVTGSLLAVGLAGCVLPVLPGHLILFLAPVAHRLMLGPERSGMEWWTFLVLFLLLAASQCIDWLSGAAGAKWFGGTRWGALGAFAGSIVGLFFLPFGLLLGPLIGAFSFEMLFAKKAPHHATYSGVGSVVGTLAGMGAKVFVGLLMVGWFLIDVFFIGK